MPPSSRPASHHSTSSPQIGKLDYTPGGRPLIPHGSSAATSPSRQGRRSSEHSYAGSFFSDIAEGILESDKRKFNRELLRYGSFAWAIINCLGAGSITAYSLYAPLFQRNLHYTQLQVNGVSITAELAMYLPVPLFGLLCDRTGPGVPSLLAGVLFGFGYVLAAFAYKSGPATAAGGEGWPYWVMVLAFVAVGCATSCMYLSAVTTCAKNFGRGKYKGVALALPIACFGLSGMWESQIGSHLLFERKADGGKGDVDVHRFFLFLGCMLFAMGAVGFFALKIVDEEELIDDAIEELEQSGLLGDSEFFRYGAGNRNGGYGTLANPERRVSAEEVDELQRKTTEQKAYQDEEQRKKTWLLNEETRRFLCDHTMWWLAAGFFLVTGPGEAFINNLGTIIGTLYPPATSSDETRSGMTTAATHVSVVAITSTIARILTGTLTDLLAPSTPSGQHRRGPTSLANSVASLPPLQPRRGFELSRMAFLITFSLIMSAGQIILASGFLQGRGNLFWLVSANIGAGYGAVFSLVPIIISVVWGVENFGTNWGIVATVPAAGATIFSLLYSGVYQWASDRGSTHGLGGLLGAGILVGVEEAKADVLCYGSDCYALTFWTMAACVWVACGLWLWAWRGPGGWWRRGVAV